MEEIGVFISYSHEDQLLARELASRLKGAGYRIWIDEIELRAGDSLLERIATAIREMEFLLALITESSAKSNWCKKELSLALTGGLNREGVKVLPIRVGNVRIPPLLEDTYCPRLDPDDLDPFVEKLVSDIRSHHRERRQAESRGEPLPTTGGGFPKSVKTPSKGTIRPGGALKAKKVPADEPIHIVGIVKEGVGEPRKDGTRGSGLYKIPLRLSRQPSERWARTFVDCWNKPPQFTTMHRPGILGVVGDTIVLDGTTLDELEDVHIRTLRLCLERTNTIEAELISGERERARKEEEERRQHQRLVDEAAERIKFEDKEPGTS